jgi:Rrf2 family protein
MLRRKTAAYALLAMYHIAREQSGETSHRGIRAGEIAQHFKLPRAYAAKILSQLASAGILSSERGPRGGFRLAKAVEDITLYEVLHGVSAVDFDRDNGLALKGLPTGVQAFLTHTQEDANRILGEVWSKTSLADLLRREG